MNDLLYVNGWLFWAWTVLAVLMVVIWGVRTWRLRQQGFVNVHGWLVPLGALQLWYGLTQAFDPLIGTGAAFILIGEFLPNIRPLRRRRRRRAPLVVEFARWRDAREPARPDLELYLEEAGARVHNVSKGALVLHGWSPAGENAWLTLRAEDGSGTAVQKLPAGEWARLLPWPVPNRGVRVWYAREDEPQAQWVFRADWAEVPTARREVGARELN